MADQCSDSDSDYAEDIPIEMLEKAKAVSMDSLPQKSKLEYTKEYNRFKQWRKSKGTSSLDESVFIVYFDELSKSLSSATLWAKFSKLRSTINKFHDIDIDKYRKLVGILKTKHAKYVPKKSPVFTSADITKFLNEAPDNQYLDIKAVCVMAIMGALRTCELVSLKYSAVQDHQTSLLTKIPGIKTPVERSFIIHGKMYEICKKYMALRPHNATQDRFFLNFQMGKCTKQPIGKNKISIMPRLIADFLNLLNAKAYTGYAFRRTSATLLVDGGGDILDLKRHGGWKSNNVAEGYVAESNSNKKRIAAKITSNLKFKPSTSKATFTSVTMANSTITDAPPTKKSKIVTSKETNNAIPSCVQTPPNSSSSDVINTFGNDNVLSDDINADDLIVPENFFASNENNFHEVNVKTDISSNKNSLFQLSNCNVTINMINDKSL